MAEEETPLTPQEQLAKEIVSALVDNQLVGEDRRARLQRQITTGLIKADDWSLMIDIAAPQIARSQ